LASLFERCDNACYCRYFAFSGDKYAWQDRLANFPQLSKQELIHGAEQQDVHARGIVAIESSTQHIVGWLKLTPASKLSKLYDQRLYRGLPCFNSDRRGVFTLGCFFVDPAFRGQGLSRRLIEMAIEYARTLGARSLEALPRGEAAASEAERWLGRPSALQAAGFAMVHDFAPYPIFRLEL
jgi:GNAT superfamily N-acetyltransferase